MEDKLISIIVPVYQGEKFLNRCLDSIIHQTYKNLEILLIDDGSTDRSGEICDEYCKRDSRIKVVHKENKGQSDARNVALDMAKGDYIGFVDNDDYIELDMYETLYKLITDNDAKMSIIAYTETYNGKVIRTRDSGKIEILDEIEAMKLLLLDDNIKSYLWDKLFKRELFDEIRLPVGKTYEDLAVMLYLIEKAKKIILQETPKYHYVRRDDSTLGFKKLSYENIKCRLEVVWDNYWNFKDKYPELRIYNAYNYILSVTVAHTNLLADNSIEKEKEFKKQFELFYELVAMYGEEVVGKLNNFRKAVVYMMLLDKEKHKGISNNACKELFDAVQADIAK